MARGVPLLFLLLASCGPPPAPSYRPVIHYDSSFKAMKNLDESIALYYAGEQPPELTTFIMHGFERGRGKSCETASLLALKKLQEMAVELGANAIINLTATWDGQPMMSGDGLSFTCHPGFGSGAAGIDWEGDFVKLHVPPGPVVIEPFEEPVEVSPDPDPSQDDDDMTGMSDSGAPPVP
jgi:hypothetical protein